MQDKDLFIHIAYKKMLKFSLDIRLNANFCFVKYPHLPISFVNYSKFIEFTEKFIDKKQQIHITQLYIHDYTNVYEDNDCSITHAC